MRPLFVANWKMNKTQAETVVFCDEFLKTCKIDNDSPDIGISPPFLSIPTLKNILKDTKGVMLGAQNCHWLKSGAHTAEVSPDMLLESGVEFCILGHSERRQFYGETDKDVAKRTRAVIDSNMKAIVCVGELEEEFKNKKTSEVVEKQLKLSLEGINEEDTNNLIIAYEPVWAIGTGLAATPEIAKDVHLIVRNVLSDKFKNSANSIPILYGGSTKPENIAELIVQPNVNGALVGGASLKPDVFSNLIQNGRDAFFNM